MFAKANKWIQIKLHRFGHWFAIAAIVFSVLFVIQLFVKKNRQQQAADEVFRLGGIASFDGMEYGSIREVVGRTVGPHWTQHIKFVDLYDSQVTDDELVVLSDLSNLESLSFARCPNITDVGILRVFEANPRLESLSIYECPGITPKSVEELKAHLPRLSNINHDWTKPEETPAP